MSTIKRIAIFFLTILLLAPVAVFAQARPEVANATKAAKRAWESAPAETKALWLQRIARSMALPQRSSG